MEDGNRPSHDQITISRRQFLREAAKTIGNVATRGITLASIGSLLEACAVTPEASQTTSAPAITSSSTESAAGAKPVDASTATARPTSGLGSRQDGDATAIPSELPTAAATPTGEAPTVAASPTTDAATATASPIEATGTLLPEQSTIPEFDDDKGRIAVLFERDLDEQVGHTSELKILLDPNQISLEDAKRVHDSKVLDDISKAMTKALINMVQGEMGLAHGVVSPQTEEGIKYDINVAEINIGRVVEKAPPLKKEEVPGDPVFDWRKADVSSRYKPLEGTGVFFESDAPALGGALRVELNILKENGAENIIGKSAEDKAEREKRGDLFKETMGRMTKLMATLAESVVEKGDLDPEWYRDQTKWFDAIGTWTVPTPTRTS